MLFPSEAILKRRLEILEQNKAGEITDVETGTRLLEVDPDCATGYLLLAGHYADQGDYTTAESHAWQALQRVPCDPRGYLSVAAIRRERAEGDAVARWLTALAYWKISFQEEMPEKSSDLVPLENPPDSPSEYAALAIAIDEQEDEEVPDDRLAPYELLNEIELEAAVGLEPDLLDRILEHSGALIPLWRGALRDWDERGYAPQLDPLAMIIALLGETAGPEMVADLLELADSGDPTIFLHTNWAIWRLGQRFPAEALAALASAKRVTQRCAAAEHIALLPKVPGRDQAVLRLLEGFEGLAKDEEAAFLLAAAVTALKQLDRPTDGGRLLRQYQKLLKKDDRRWLQDELDAGFVGRLRDAEIDGLTVEEICSERILMEIDEEEDEEDYDDFDDEEDDFDDDIEPAIAAVKPGRNDPCWCGSGQKYKKCHLAADEEAERGGGESAESVHQQVYEQLMEGLYKWTSQSDFEEATRLYFGVHPSEVDPEDGRMSAFFEWCLHDFRPPSMGHTMVEECLRRRAGTLGRAERKLLQEWREARFGVWEVQNVKKGEGVELKDWFEGDRFFVHDVSSSRSMKQWDCVLGRIYPSEGRWYFAGNSSGVPRNLMDCLAEQIERESRECGQSPVDYLRAHSYRWHREVAELHRTQFDKLRVVNAEGDDLELSSAEYRVEDETAVADALRQARPFEPMEDAGGVRRLGWLEQTEGPRRSYGSIEIRDGKLRLECNSRKRLAIGRQLIEKHAGKWLRHLGDRVESQGELKRSALEGRSRSVELPKVDQELSLKLKAEYYEHWLDEPIPALNGRTPREAARSETGRKAVEDLLRLMENAEAHGRSRGAGAFDFSEIRKALDL